MVDLRGRYEDLERAAIAATDLPIHHVPDDEDQHVDGVTIARIPVDPSRGVYCGAREDAPIEVKTCQQFKSSGDETGRWVLHRHQHDTLADSEGVYLLAVLDGTDVLRWVVCGPHMLDPLLTWAGVATRGVNEIAGLAWPQIFGDVQWNGHGRCGYRIDLHGGDP